MSNRWDPHHTPLVDALRAKLDEDGMTVRKAGDIAGVSGQTVANWARGTVAPKMNAEHQAGLARLLQVSPRSVLEMAGFDLEATLVSDASGSYHFPVVRAA